MLPVRRVALAVVAVLLVGGGCSSDGVSDVSGDGTTTTIGGVPAEVAAGRSFRPLFVPAACAAGVPSSPRVHCGWLVTREDRMKPTGPTVRLPVAIVDAKSAATPHADPVVYLAGGPGASGLAGVEGFLDDGYAGDRDVVVFDQRGTGAARPSLNCPEVERAVRATFATADRPAVEQQVMAAGYAACHDRLVAAGVDLAAYRTETSADDVEDLRVALGYRQVDLYATSYGTALALTVLRRHAAGVRSATLDAVYPTTIANGPGEVAANATRAIDELGAGCRRSPSCNATAPDLLATLAAAVKRFDATPHVGSFDDAKTGEPVPVRITGADVQAGIVQAMYQPSSIAALPAAIVALQAGDGSGIDDVVGTGINGLTSLSEGMAASVECADRARRPSSRSFAEVVAAEPAMSTLALIADLTAVCADWAVPPASAAFSTPLRSAVPTLLLSGAYDPVTPPANAATVSEGLTRSSLVLMPAGGHGAVFSSACATRVFQAFLRAPSQAPDVACVASPESPWPS